MAIGKVRKQPPARTPKPPRQDDPGKRRCGVCGHERKIAEFRYIDTSLLDPPTYLCNQDCYSTWQGQQSAKMAPPL